MVNIKRTNFYHLLGKKKTTKAYNIQYRYKTIAADLGTQKPTDGGSINTGVSNAGR